MTGEDINLRIGALVKEYRKKMEKSQQYLANKLNLPRPAISQIESGQRKLSPEELLKLSGIFNLTVDQLIGAHKTPEVILPTGRVKEKSPKYSVRVSVPQKNVSKFKEVLLYILNKVGSKPNIGETVIYKLLYFIDFNFYEKYEEQLIGATYIKNHYGPTPIEFGKIVDLMIKNKELVKVENEYFEFMQRKYLPLRKPDLSKLKANETEIIDDVLKRLSDMNAKQISEYSHNDLPWQTSEEGKSISYESVFYRDDVYSVRTYEDEL